MFQARQTMHLIWKRTDGCKHHRLKLLLEHFCSSWVLRCEIFPALLYPVNIKDHQDDSRTYSTIVFFLTHIANLILLPSTLINLTLKSTPIVAACSLSNVSSVNLRRRLKRGKSEVTKLTKTYFIQTYDDCRFVAVVTTT